MTLYTLIIKIKKGDRQRNTILEYASKDIQDIEKEIVGFTDKYSNDKIKISFSIKVEIQDWLEPEKKETKHPAFTKIKPKKEKKDREKELPRLPPPEDL